MKETAYGEAATRMVRAFAETADALNSTRDTDKLLDLILDLVNEVFSIENCAVLLLDPVSQRLSIRRARGYDPDTVQEYSAALGEGIAGSVALKGMAERIDDVWLDPRYRKGTRAGRSEMLAPLRSGGKIIGVLDAESPFPEAFGEGDLDFFAIFASQAATALYNAALYEAALRHTEKIAFLHRVGSSLNAITDPAALLVRIISIAQQALGFDYASILLYDVDKARLVVRESFGYSECPNGKSVPAGEGITGYAAERAQSVLVPDVRADPRYIAGTSDARSEMACPLVVHGQVLGVLDAESVGAAFDEEDLALFELFAAQVATALYNAELVTKLEETNEELLKMNIELQSFADRLSETNLALERRVKELQTLYEAGKTITSSLNLEETLHSIIKMTTEIVNISSAAIMLVDEETSELTVKVKYESENATKRIGGEHHRVDIPLKIRDRVIGRFWLSKLVSDSISDEDAKMLQTLASQAAIAIENAKLFEKTQEAYYDTITSLAHALEARDPYTKGHSERVTEYSLLVARRLCLDEKTTTIIRYAGLLHDIGKIGISDEILHKPQRLDPDDFERIKAHSDFGNAILGPLRFLQESQEVVRHHHEHWDGSGYPDGIAGDLIPLAARIIGVADAFDAMTSDRPYRKALSQEAALAELERGSGSQFDPIIAIAFIQSVRDDPAAFRRE
jgi:HD-GYP domain-containing protein (c-di-GMP phosphodiesterase class II)